MKGDGKLTDIEGAALILVPLAIVLGLGFYTMGKERELINACQDAGGIYVGGGRNASSKPACIKAETIKVISP